jgi:hypothetical protein
MEQVHLREGVKSTHCEMAECGRECVKTLWCHLHHVNFGYVRELARDFSNSSRLLEHVRGRLFLFSHGLGQLRT